MTSIVTCIVNTFILPQPRPSYDTQLSGLRQLAHIPVLYVKQPARVRRGVVVFLHSNGTDLGRICRFVYRLSTATRMDVVAPEYPGYGIRCQESATVDGCTTTAKTIISVVSCMYRQEPVIVVGRSIGVAIGVEALRQIQSGIHNLHGMLLISPFTSIGDVIQEKIPWIGRLIRSAAYTNILDTMVSLQTITSPNIVVIHGRDDRLVPMHHAQRLHHAHPRIRLIVVPGTHDRLETIQIIRALLMVGRMGKEEKSGNPSRHPTHYS